MAERVAPTKIHQFLPVGSIVAYTFQLADRSGMVKKGPADGYLGRKLISVCLTLASVLDEFHPYPMIFSNGLERLVVQLFIHEKVLQLKKRSAGCTTRRISPSLGCPEWLQASLSNSLPMIVSTRAVL